jgi:hypothetical protein
MKIYVDPRGELRTIKSVEFTPEANLVTFEECGHVGEKTATMTFKVGTQTRCFKCRIPRVEESFHPYAGTEEPPAFLEMEL